ncbi:hypothetical protein MKZ38_001227 [Zalerion maritima]|uniref:Rap-GAP domain-containing protein n=1 Tax=Zalerion maritima TaxID=339359 RepID=A0AAD5WS25_9PEZI|nr:hypothetical protein MKZ38_001227 [Zalerion maritima]
MLRFIASLGQQPESPDEAPMTPPTGDVSQTPESRSAGGLTSVFRGLTGSRLVRSPPPQASSTTSPTTANPILGEGSNVSPPNPNYLSPAHLEFFETLKTGTPNDRVAAANSLRYAISDYAPGCVLSVWEAGKDLIDASKSSAARAAGWELLTECVKHPDSTDLERKEYFETISRDAHLDDFHLQLAALVDLTKNGRDLSGFDYDVIPLLAEWLEKVFETVRAARKAATKGIKKGKPVPATGEDKNLAQLFNFIMDIIKFNFNVAKEAAVSALLDGVINICNATSHEEDLTACISVINSIVTFGAIPNDKLKPCVQVLSSIYCFVPQLQKVAWHTLGILCRLHNGQETVRILLAILRNPPKAPPMDSNRGARDVRGALSVLQKLLSKTTEKGYPPVPVVLLMEGLAMVVKTYSSMTTRTSVLSVINSLFANGSQRPHHSVVEEDWSELLDIAAKCASVLPTSTGDGYDSGFLAPSASDSKHREQVKLLNDELTLAISHVEYFLRGDQSDFTQRHSCVSFLTSVHQFLPDSAARIIMDYLKEFRCCMPSDNKWESNLHLVMSSFFKNQRYNTETRLQAMAIVRESYDMVEIVADQLEEGATTKFVKSIFAEISEESDIAVLREALDLVVMMAVSAPMSLFEFIIDSLRIIVNNDRLRSPISPPTNVVLGSNPGLGEAGSETPLKSPSDIITTAYVRIFMQTMHSDSAKTVRIYNLLVNIAKSRACETDARLTAMKLLFRLRADWGNNIFLVPCTYSERMASYLCRTKASLARRRKEDHAQRSRPSARPARGVSFGTHGQAADRNTPTRSSSGAKPPPPRYQQLWMLPDADALPEEVSAKSSPILLSHADDSAKTRTKKQTILNMASWLDALLYLLQQGSDWEVYSFVLVHLPSQLSNHAIFRDAIPQIQDLRKIICDRIKTSGFQEPPDVIGLRKSDVALCLFQLLSTIISYHNHFQKTDEDEIVASFLLGLNIWDRSYRCCIHAIAVCAHELPMSTSKSLVPILNRMAQIISQPVVSIHILEFLACLSRMPALYSHFREEEYRIVFGICFRYLQYVRDKKQSQRVSISVPPTPATAAHTNGTDASLNNPNASEDLPQYVYALAYHVITFWFHQIRLPDRASYVHMITKQLFSDVDGTNTIEEQAETTIDFMQRIAFADNDESIADPLFTEERFGPINTKSWIVGQSIVTIRQAASSGWSQITKRQASGTSSFTIRESLKPPPPHQVQSQPHTNREGKLLTNVDILPSHLMVHLFNIAPQTESVLRPIPLPDNDNVKRSLRLFDHSSTVDNHKVGVIYIGDGQTKETEILANVSGSREYVEFLNGLGTLTRLKSSNFNTAGLDREYDTDGKYTFCWRDKVTEIVFHVTTQMPTNLDHDAQCINKKKHIGNDYVNIIFNDSGLPFYFDTFPGDFNFVKIVITPESRASFTASRAKSMDGMQQTFYKVHVMSKPGFPEISPASETKMVSLESLPEFVRLLALNASVFSNVWANRDGEHISSWRGRLRDIKRLREKYAPKPTTTSAAGGITPTGISPSPPGTSLGVMGGDPTRGAMAAAAGTGPGSIRDSFGSFRRSSVATFFTNTSEQTSHRSSVLSTTNTADTELIPSSGMESIVETLDFSRWA